MNPRRAMGVSSEVVRRLDLRNVSGALKLKTLQ